jgi:hypothetical protein
MPSSHIRWHFFLGSVLELLILVDFNHVDLVFLSERGKRVVPLLLNHLPLVEPDPDLQTLEDCVVLKNSRRTPKCR